MPLVPGLTSSIRQQRPPEPEDDDVEIIELPDENVANDNGDVLEIKHDDGSITISLDGNSLVKKDGVDSKKGWFDNILDDIDAMEQGRISDDLMREIQSDLDSRKDWTEDRAQIIKMLGLKIELPGVGGSAEGAPVEGMSKVRHPMMLEAVLRFQANSRSEFLPTDGPAKIRNDDNNADLPEDDLADAFERDLNHYLTVTASEYYPDTDRMFLMLGLGGSTFKKVYFCPLRNRPVSESVDADDLIVNSSATDLKNAKRKTHRVFMKPSTVKRLQILGVYKDVDLHTPQQRDLDSAQREKLEQSGMEEESSINPDDRDREIYECYCELDIKGYEHKHKGKPSGLEIPWRVTIDVSSKRLLSVVRGYGEDTKELPEEKEVFVKYTFIPGFGFYDIGLGNILANTTNAVTAAWREMLDGGMFANFPGFLLADVGARQNTNIFRVPPGGAAVIKTGGLPIGDVVANLPYKEPGPALMQLVQNMVETGQRVGGTSELQVGEGRADAPVGTTLALIDQAVKVLNSVHKRMHTSQARELQLMKECFRENPESFWQRNRRPARKWDQETFLRALENFDLVPQSDPNTSSHAQRLMKIVGLKQLQAAQPSLYDPIAIDKAALRAMGWSNPESFMAPVDAQKQKPPELMQVESKIKAEQMDADSRAKTADAKVAETQAKIQQGAFAPKPGLTGGKETAPEELQIKALDAQTKARQVAEQARRAHIEDENRDKDRNADLDIAQMDLAGDMLKDHHAREHEKVMQIADHAHAHSIEKKRGRGRPKGTGKGTGKKEKPRE